MSRGQDDFTLELFRRKNKLRHSRKDFLDALLEKKMKENERRLAGILDEADARVKAIETDFDTKVHRILNPPKSRDRGRLPKDIRELINDIAERDKPKGFTTKATQTKKSGLKKKRQRSVWVEFIFPMLCLTAMFLFLPPNLESPQRYKDLASFSLGMADPLGTVIFAIMAFLHIVFLPHHLMRLWRKMSVNHE